LERQSDKPKIYNQVKWENICKLKDEGGLGVINLQDINKALLDKWWWKLHISSQSALSTMMTSKYVTALSVFPEAPFRTTSHF